MGKMKGEMWQHLPEDLLGCILGKLPCREFARMGIVCKRWRELLGSVNRNSRGFLVHSIKLGSADIESMVVESWVIEESADFYRVPLGGFPAESKHIERAYDDMYCCSHAGEDGRFCYTICKPNHEPIPIPIPIPRIARGNSSFLAIAYDSSKRRWTIVVGKAIWGDDSVMMEVYDSESNAWTQIQTRPPHSLSPTGIGVYSKGRFYWLSSFSDRRQVVGFDVENRRWSTIPPPSSLESCCYSWDLTGNEERLILIDKEFGWMCKLEDEGKEWGRLNMNMPETMLFTSTNRSGWTLVLGDKIYLYDEDGRLANTIELIQLDLLTSDRSSAIVSPFDCNNACWPS